MDEFVFYRFFFFFFLGGGELYGFVCVFLLFFCLCDFTIFYMVFRVSWVLSVSSLCLFADFEGLVT